MTAPIEWQGAGDAPFRFALLDIDGANQAPYATLLNPNEIIRAQAYRRPQDARRFMIRRGWLRLTLADVSGDDPAALRFGHTAAGKPSLADHAAIRFNTSHSQGLALLTVAHDRDIGCDIEHCDPAQAQPDVADRFFSPAERASLATLTGDAWLEGFFACWTRKEAYVKALGTGLSHPMQGFTVSLAPGAPARLIDAAPGWTLHALPVPRGWQAAVVHAH